MSDDLDDLLTAEDRAELAAWDADAYRIVVEVPTSKITDAQLDDLNDRISEAVADWEASLSDRDWDPFVYGHGPMHRRMTVAPQEPACQWAHGPVTDLDSRGLCPVCAEDDA